MTHTTHPQTKMLRGLQLAALLCFLASCSPKPESSSGSPTKKPAPVGTTSCKTDLPAGSNLKLLCNPSGDDIHILYDEQRRIPRAVSERLQRSQLGGNIKRTDEFQEDPRLPHGATLNDYRRSGYDRGHLAPAADFKNNESDMQRSFLLSNIAPQNSGLNRNAWAGLEDATRECAASLGELHVVTGTIPSNLKIKGRVSVPSAFFKAWSNGREVRAWIMPNIGTDTPIRKLNGAEYARYAVSPETLRERTGLNLFPGSVQGKFCKNVISL